MIPTETPKPDIDDLIYGDLETIPSDRILFTSRQLFCIMQKTL